MNIIEHYIPISIFLPWYNDRVAHWRMSISGAAASHIHPAGLVPAARIDLSGCMHGCMDGRAVAKVGKVR